MENASDERQHLLSADRPYSVDGENCHITHSVNGQAYYDSFPRISSPEDELDTDKEQVPEIDGARAEGAEKIKVYTRRWYILIVFSMFTMSQNIIWNTWGPISASSEEAFDWHDSTIAWLNNWGPISYILCGLFYPWLLQVKGLRWAVVSSMLLLTVGAGLRCITSVSGPATILIHVGQFLNGLAGPMAMGAIPTLSSVWFPPHERVTATGIGSSLGQFGIAISFIMGPLLVPTGPPKHDSTNTTNVTSYISLSHSDYDFISSYEQSMSTPEPANVTDARIRQEKNEIMWYMYYAGIFTAALCALIIIYFPAKPPHPPCASAVAKRQEYWSGFWSLRNKNAFLVVALVYGISTGVLNCWSSVLYVNIKTVGVSEDTAGWIGFYSTIGAGFGSLFIGGFANHFARRLKVFILVLFVLGTACFIVFTLMLVKTLQFSTVLLWVTIIGGTTLVNSAVPLMFELACELAYPTSEGAANGVMTYINNIGGLIFLAVFSFPHIGTMWMNWALIGALFACIPLIVVLRGRFHRLELDEAIVQGIEQSVKVDPRGSVQA